MTATTATPKATWPRIETCDCGERVLRARGTRQGRPFTLDPIPVLPLGKCGPCGGRGTIRFQEPVSGHGGNTVWATYEPGDLTGRTRFASDTCPACGGTGQRGEQLTADHVLVDPNGIARFNDDDRSHWEAAHRRHRCPA